MLTREPWKTGNENARACVCRKLNILWPVRVSDSKMKNFDCGPSRSTPRWSEGRATSKNSSGKTTSSKGEKIPRRRCHRRERSRGLINRDINFNSRTATRSFSRSLARRSNEWRALRLFRAGVKTGYRRNMKNAAADACSPEREI